MPQLDTEDMLKSFSDWEPPRGGGQRTSLAFLCEAPAEVERIHLTDLFATQENPSA